MSASVPQLQGLAPPTPLPCERCGFSPPSARIEVAGRKVCVLCASQFVQESRPLRPLWPTLYVFAIGLISPVAPPVLAALNWLRLGDARRARACLFLVIAGLVATVGQMVAVMEKLSPERQLPFSIAGLWVAFFSTVALAPRYAEHRRRGGPRANLFAPVGLTLVMTLGLMLGVLGYLVALGKVSPDDLTKPGAFDTVSWVHPHPEPESSSRGLTHAAGAAAPKKDRVPRSG